MSLLGGANGIIVAGNENAYQQFGGAVQSPYDVAPFNDTASYYLNHSDVDRTLIGETLTKCKSEGNLKTVVIWFPMFAMIDDCKVGYVNRYEQRIVHKHSNIGINLTNRFLEMNQHFYTDTTTLDSLIDAVKYYKSLGLKVGLLPVVRFFDPDTGSETWRGNVSWDKELLSNFSQTYYDAIKVLCRDLSRYNRDSISLFYAFSEMESLTRHNTEDVYYDWVQLCNDTNRLIKSYLNTRTVYAANYTEHLYEFRCDKIFAAFDAIGIDCYFNAGISHETDTDVLYSNLKDGIDFDLSVTVSDSNDKLLSQSDGTGYTNETLRTIDQFSNEAFKNLPAFLRNGHYLSNQDASKFKSCSTHKPIEIDISSDNMWRINAMAKDSRNSTSKPIGTSGVGIERVASMYLVGNADGFDITLPSNSYKIKFTLSEIPMGRSILYEDDNFCLYVFDTSLELVLKGNKLKIIKYLNVDLMLPFEVKFDTNGSVTYSIVGTGTSKTNLYRHHEYYHTTSITNSFKFALSEFIKLSRMEIDIINSNGTMSQRHALLFDCPYVTTNFYTLGKDFIGTEVGCPSMQSGNIQPHAYPYSVTGGQFNLPNGYLHYSLMQQHGSPFSDIGGVHNSNFEFDDTVQASYLSAINRFLTQDCNATDVIVYQLNMVPHDTILQKFDYSYGNRAQFYNGVLHLLDHSVNGKQTVGESLNW